jgi:hypothetical protein
MATPQHYDKYIVQSLVGNASWSSITRHGQYYHVGTIPNRRNHTYVSDLRMMIAGSTTGTGFSPVAIYARRARKPLLRNLSDDPTCTSWEMLGTNLSVKLKDDASQGHPSWTTETQRLLLMDRKDFNQLGIGVDDLIDAYVQTVLSVIAIDKMCQRLMPKCSITEERERPEDLDVPIPAGNLSGSFEHPQQSRVEVLEVFERDGVKYVREKITRYERRFDSALFEALNPDKALLQEILR